MNMRILLLTALLALFCVSPIMAAPPSDAEASRLLLGEWKGQKRPGLVDSTMTFKADGTFDSSATIATPGGEITIKVEGKWRVEKGILIEELTKSSRPDLVPVGLSTGDMLLSVTDKEYRYRSEKGTEGVDVRPEGAAKTPAK